MKNVKEIEIPYKVETFRSAGLEARWSKTRRGAPMIVVRNPKSKSTHQREKWWMVDKSMHGAMKKNGIAEGFDQATLLGSFFSIPA